MRNSRMYGVLGAAFLLLALPGCPGDGTGTSSDDVILHPSTDAWQGTDAVATTDPGGGPDTTVVQVPDADGPDDAVTWFEFPSPILPDAYEATDPGPAHTDVGAGTDTSIGLPRFSFFVASMAALQDLSGNVNGFGGDLRFGETGPGAGIRGADKICTTIAERSMPGSSAKHWRAFLCAAQGEDGKQVDAIDRIGNGPWYDRLGRLIAPDLAHLGCDRPEGGSAAIRCDLPNEDGVPNHRPDPTQPLADNHDILTGCNADGRLMPTTFLNRDFTCNGWTANSGAASEGMPRVGHSWPVACSAACSGGSMIDTVNSPNWKSSLTEAGCAPGINILDTNPDGNPPWVGAGGGYGGFYCFALVP